MSQSSNDTFPTAMHVAVAVAVRRALEPAVTSLRDALTAKADAWSDVVTLGRTHLQDATPLTLGQQWTGYASLLTADLARLDAAMPDVLALALGGTAVGTGVTAPAGFAEGAAERIAELTGLPFTSAADKVAAQGSHDALVHLSGTLRTLAVSLRKLADDVRLLASGPRAGIGELVLPDNEPGSSIMPGKVNPTQAEALSMVCAQVMGNDVAVGLAGSGGHLQMNAFKPLLVRNLLQSVQLLADACTSFRVHLVEGAEPDRRVIADHVNRSLMLVTALSPVIGYDAAARVAHHAREHDLSLREAALELGVVSAEEFDRVVDPAAMTHPAD